MTAVPAEKLDKLVERWEMIQHELNLGASQASYVQLSKEFVWLVIAGCLIASFLSYWLMENWLQKYDYRIDISWWVFAFAGLMAIGIALLTVSSHSIKAALTNPAKSLRSE